MYAIRSYYVTPLESRLLEALMLHAGQVLSSESLITAVWGSDGGDKTMLKQLVYRLRSKIDTVETAVSLIETIPGIGYSVITSYSIHYTKLYELILSGLA